MRVRPFGTVGPIRVRPFGTVETIRVRPFGTVGPIRVRPFGTVEDHNSRCQPIFRTRCGHWVLAR